MTVGPRYIPGSVKYAAKISPPLAEGRAGRDISIDVNVNAGVPVEEIRSTSHLVDQVNFNPNSSKVTLKSEKTIPNKDFILRYDVTGKRIEDGLLTHRDARGGFFTLMLQPPDKIATEDRTPKEIVFALDTSGSGSGSGNSSASVSAVVEIADSPTTVDASETKVQTNLSRKTVEQLPKGTNFSSLLKISPGIVNSSGGGLQVDGSSGSENTIVIDGTEVTNFHSGTLNANNRLSLNGRASVVPEPVYSTAARQANALGKFEVEVRIDKTGSVVSAKAVSGHKLLRESAEAAALLSKFDPAFLDGRPIRVTGSIVYNFKNADSVDVSLLKMKAKPFNDEDRKAFAVGVKLHFWLYAMTERLRNGVSEASPNEAKFVNSGKAETQVFVKAKSPQLMEKLKNAGFQIASEKGPMLSGRMAVEKIAALAEIDEVKLVLPKT